LVSRRAERDLSPEEREFARQWTLLVTQDGDYQNKTARALHMTEAKMSRYCKGTHLPSDDEIAALLTHREVGLDRRLDLLQLLARAREARQDRRTARVSERRADLQAFIRNHKVAVAVIAFVAVLAGGAIVIRGMDGKTSSTQPEQPIPHKTSSTVAVGVAGSPINHGWPAKVANTWSPDSKEWEGFKGVNVYRDPYETGRDSKVDAYQEGRALSVVCQERHGREIKNSALNLTSPVWNKLAENAWIPDLYTDLPKVVGDSPPLGIPICRKP
jgi:hypothetical protein